MGKGQRLKTVQYLDAVKKRLGIESDYALAQRLELTKQAISALRSRRLVMSNTTAARVAAILELEPMRVIADAELERGSDGQLWKKLRDAAAAVLVALGAALFPMPDAQAAGFNINVATVPGDFRHGNRAPRALTVYTLRAAWRWLRRVLGGRP